MPNWRQSTKNTKVELYSEATLKNDSGSCAVFTEQGSSASQMTAAKVMDIISRLPGCAGTSSWCSICLYPGNNGGCTQIIAKFQNRNVQTFGFVYHDTSGPKSLSSMEDPVVPLERNLYGHLLVGLFVGKAIWENPIAAPFGRRFPIGNAYSYTVKKKGGWKETKHWSDVESTQQRSWFGRTNIFLWSCIPGMYSTTMWNKQRYCWQLQNHVWITHFRGENWKNYHARKIFVFLRGPTIWKVMPRSVWRDIVSWQTGRLNNSTKYLHHALMTITSKRKNWNLLENCQKVCSHLVLKCLYLARIGRPDILWSANKLARSITNWTKACDKRLNRLISYIQHTCEYKQLLSCG